MKTWRLEYTLSNAELDAEVTCKLDTTNPGAAPAVLERFIKEGTLLGFHLTLIDPELGDTSDWLDEDNDWEEEDE